MNPLYLAVLIFKMLVLFAGVVLGQKSLTTLSQLRTLPKSTYKKAKCDYMEECIEKD